MRLSSRLVNAVLFLLASCSGPELPLGNSGNGPGPRAQAGSTPAPAPGGCEDLTITLQARYEALRSCERDSDCEYVSGYFERIPREQSEGLVRLFDCKAESPLLGFANGEALEAARDELSRLQKEQAKACARPPGTVICQAFSDIPVQPPPLCRLGGCQPAVLPVGSAE